VQVYRGFDIGSAKPTSDELAGIPHHLIDVLEPDEPIDAVGYAELADRAIADIAARGRLPIVVGGTGLWLRALLRGLVDVPKVDTGLRARLEEEAAREGGPALHRRLVAVDPRAAAAIHENDVLRIVRALEVFEQTGEPLGELRARHALGAPRYPGLFLFVDRSMEELEPRIATRVREMLATGVVAETRDLIGRFGARARALSSVGYAELVEHLTQGIPLDETERRIVKSTRTYARRQRNWFRSEPGFTRIVLGETTEADVLARARAVFPRIEASSAS
jgi:tRNA dimethylallyltransferase